MKILTVDDTKTMREMIRDTLSQNGYEVIEAYDGKDGILKLLNTRVDLIITDLHMPNIDGIEFLRRVRKSFVHKHTPVVMLTTESQKAKVLEAVSLGINGWILKPFTPEQLLEKVQKVLGNGSV